MFGRIRSTRQVTNRPTFIFYLWLFLNRHRKVAKTQRQREGKQICAKNTSVTSGPAPLILESYLHLFACFLRASGYLWRGLDRWTGACGRQEHGLIDEAGA